VPNRGREVVPRVGVAGGVIGLILVMLAEWTISMVSSISSIPYIYIYLVGGFKHDFFIFHFIYGMSSFPLTHFFRGVKIVLVNYKDIQV
jgi:hypothetical protein